MPVNYSSAAELYVVARSGPKPHMVHRRFPTAAEAVQFAMEGAKGKLASVVLEVDEQRFESAAIRAMYRADDYPLARPVGWEDTAGPVR